MKTAADKTRRDARPAPNTPGAEGKPEEKKPRDFGRFFIWVVSLGFLGLWGLLLSRFFQLQVVEGPEYAAQAQRQHLTAEVFSGKRGSIFDRNGNVLATTIESYSLSARVSELRDLDASVAFLSKTLGLPARQIRKNLENRKGFVWVARKISDRSAKAILEAQLPGLYLQKEYERVYPYKHLAGQLLGFAGMDNKGLEGLEASFDERLSGRELRKVVQRDARGGRLYLDGRDGADALSGQDLRLTLDIQIQYFAEAALARTVSENQASWGGCLVVDVESAEILAWAHYPFFNPNVYNRHSDFDRRNKLALDALEQGSTVKPFVVAAALQENKITPKSRFFCENGKWEQRGYTIRDTRPNGELNVEEILRFSSNIGAGKIGLALGAQSYGDFLRRLGFGQRSGLPLVGESPGIMRDPAKWPETDLVAASFGQSFSATAVQMAQAYLCLAGNGVKRPLQLVMDENLRAEGEKERIFTAEVSAQVLAMLSSVVQSDDGGGRYARIPGLEIGGKTGTAQKAFKGSYGEKRVASFVGLVPARKPKYLVLVVVDEPEKNIYGSAVAIPAFREVLRHTLAYTGVLPEGPGGVQQASVELELDISAYAQLSAKKDAESKTRSWLGLDAPAGSSTVRQPVGEAPLISDALEVVPDVRGMSVRRAVEMFAYKGVLPSLRGNGDTVVKQAPAPGSGWSGKAGAEYVLWLEDKLL